MLAFSQNLIWISFHVIFRSEDVKHLFIRIFNIFYIYQEFQYMLYIGKLLFSAFLIFYCVKLFES
jgi:hypothetical protein